MQHAIRKLVQHIKKPSTRCDDELFGASLITGSKLSDFSDTTTIFVMSHSPTTHIPSIADMRSLLLSPSQRLNGSPPPSHCSAKEQETPDRPPQGYKCTRDELPIETKQSGSYEDRNDILIQKTSRWISDLTLIREKLERASVENSITLDSLYMTGTVEDWM